MGDKCTISVDDLDDLVARTEGFTGADLANVCKQAALVGLKRAWSTWTPDFGETEDDMEYNEHTPSETTQDAARGNRENNLEGNREGEVVMDESKGDMIGAKSELANTRSGMSLGDDVAIREQDSVAGTSGSKVGKRLPVADYTSAHNDHSQKSGANLFYGSKLPDLRVTKEDILCALEQCSPSVSADMLQMHVDWQAKHQRAS
ncbi:hypothetical protein SARC_14247 [Sphaeroforma arctica JP610]|uniref:AAA ATPase AAA+ lid domain-containing protein n=1 Tax=Sphaeroforma arctica JP610 TaxID=667725 RepID=A0A0L0F8Z6_9EUKA|nr:hypothetical protein SARC_14247 [Sphaeroforma arctica JP610]KNC73194.1 hypothetical protein SARC_14247 [Sphaeroforma arctica JP610]|eukprot:XP_014147096.1 hypothetical protein SARC_14247 [Sphaeroforma arctica JP610]